MRERHQHHTSLHSRLKYLVADLFRLKLADPDTIDNQAPLLATFGLDSLDALELALRLEDEFGITIDSREEIEGAFVSITTLAEFIQIRQNAAAIPPRDSGRALLPGPIQAPLVPA